jgi:hypothetical protein
MVGKKNNINIQPSKGISIIIKNDISQPEEQPKPKRKKRRNKRKTLLNNLPQIPNGLFYSAGDTSYIKAPSSYQLYRDTLNTTGGMLPPPPLPQSQQLQLPAPPQLPQLPAPPQQLQLPAPPVTFNNYGMPPISEWYKNMMMPQMMTNDPAGTGPIIEDVSNDPLYNALSYDPRKQEEYKEQKLEQISQEITDKADETVAAVEATPYFRTITPAEQDRIKEFTRYQDMQKRLGEMKDGPKKGWATKDADAGRPARYPTDDIYRKAYKDALERLRQQQQDIIDNARTPQNQKRAAATRIRELVALADRTTSEKKEL